MAFSPFFVLFFTYLVFQLNKKKWLINELFFFLIPIELTFELFINVGYLIKIGNLEISASDFLFSLLVFLAVYKLLTTRVNRNLIILAILFIYIIIIGLILLACKPVDSGIISYSHNWDFDYYKSLFEPASIKLVQIRMIFMIIAYTPILIFVQNSYPPNFKKEIADTLYSSLNVIYLILMIEFILKNILKSNLFSEIILNIFGKSNSTIYSLLQRGGTYGLQGLAREPSQMAKSLFLATGIFLLLCNNNIQKARKIAIFSIISLIFVRSLIGFASIIIIILMYYIIFKVDRKIIILILLSILIFIIYKNIKSFNYYFDRISVLLKFLSVPQNKWIYFTNQPRIISIIETFRLFMKRPIFGIGYGITYAHSFIATGLVSLGIAGMTVWFKMQLFNRVLQFHHLIILTLIIIFWFINGYIGELYSISSLILILSIGKVHIRSERYKI